MTSKARPSSAQSRTAWGDYGGARPDSQFDFGADGIRDDADLSPTAMEDDSVYVSGDKSKGKSSAVATTSKQSKSCFGTIGGGIRSLWATRQTEDVSGDRELHVKTTLRELIIYIVFLVILCIVTFGMTQTTMYYYTKVMSDLFVDKTWTGGGSFGTITSVEDFWKFAKEPLLNGLYWETWYNNQTVPDDQLGYIYYENKLLGVPRLRQLQVHSNSCVVHDDFKDVIRECYESYSESLENKQPFGLMDNETAWFYRSQDELDGSSHWGKIATYSGAGYIMDLTRNKSQSEDIINYLFDNRWIRRGTRILFIDFTVYNANINLFCVIRLTVEFPPTGGAIPHATMRTVKLIRYVTVFDYFIMACEFILCLFILYYMVEEAIEIKKHKFSYFKSVWNILDILVIAIAIVCVVFNVYRTIKVDELLKELLDKPDQYADFEFLSYGQTQFDNAIAIAVFLAWIKIFKYISFNKTMTQLSSTLGKCAKDLAGFAVMFFIIFLAFTQLGYLLFGTQVKDFSDFQNSFFTLFRIILGDFNFDQLEQANRVLGPIFFMLFVFFVFFVLINMFLAIINDTYSEVKGDMANQKNEFEMGDYFKRGYEKMLNKLNFKHDKIVDIQKALQSADINNDKQVDFDEWRQDLKTRGYADGEIEALFAKYDIDGDRVLDEEEQKRMQADLNDQKAALTKEYDELDKIQRPESARRSASRVSFNDDSADDSEDDDSHTKSSRSGPSQGVSYEEFTVLSRRVDRMEHSIGSIVSKIDAVLVKLEAMEKAKLKRRETMGKILDSITESDGTSDEVKREQMERLVREELERWDSESSITPQPSGRGASPSSSGRGGARSRSGGNAPSFVRSQEQVVEACFEHPKPSTPILVEKAEPECRSEPSAHIDVNSALYELGASLPVKSAQSEQNAQGEPPKPSSHSDDGLAASKSVPDNNSLNAKHEDENSLENKSTVINDNHLEIVEKNSPKFKSEPNDKMAPMPDGDDSSKLKLIVHFSQDSSLTGNYNPCMNELQKNTSLSPQEGSTSNGEASESLLGKIDLRPITPILPGIPSKSYSSTEQSLELRLPRPGSKDSDHSIKSNASYLRPMTRGSNSSHESNISLTRPVVLGPLSVGLNKTIGSSNLPEHSSNPNVSRPMSKASDRSCNSNLSLPSPVSDKTVIRNGSEFDSVSLSSPTSSNCSISLPSPTSSNVSLSSRTSSNSSRLDSSVLMSSPTLSKFEPLPDIAVKAAAENSSQFVSNSQANFLNNEVNACPGEGQMFPVMETQTNDTVIDQKENSVKERVYKQQNKSCHGGSDVNCAATDTVKKVEPGEMQDHTRHLLHNKTQEDNDKILSETSTKYIQPIITAKGQKVSMGTLRKMSKSVSSSLTIDNSSSFTDIKTQQKQQRPLNNVQTQSVQNIENKGTMDHSHEQSLISHTNQAGLPHSADTKCQSIEKSLVETKMSSYNKTRNQSRGRFPANTNNLDNVAKDNTTSKTRSQSRGQSPTNTDQLDNVAKDNATSKTRSQSRGRSPSNTDQTENVAKDNATSKTRNRSKGRSPANTDHLDKVAKENATSKTRNQSKGRSPAKSAPVDHVAKGKATSKRRLQYSDNADPDNHVAKGSETCNTSSHRRGSSTANANSADNVARGIESRNPASQTMARSSPEDDNAEYVAKVSATSKTVEQSKSSSILDHMNQSTIQSGMSSITDKSGVPSLANTVEPSAKNTRNSKNRIKPSPKQPSLAQSVSVKSQNSDKINASSIVSADETIKTTEPDSKLNNSDPVEVVISKELILMECQGPRLNVPQEGSVPSLPLEQGKVTVTAHSARDGEEKQAQVSKLSTAPIFV